MTSAYQKTPITAKVLISRLYKELLQINKKKTLVLEQALHKRDYLYG